MEHKLTHQETVAMMDAQPEGTDLVVKSEGGYMFRKLDTGMWHAVESTGIHPYGWGSDDFGLEDEERPWAFL